MILIGGVNHFMPTVTYFQPRWPDCVLHEVFIHALLDEFYHMLNAHFTAISKSNQNWALKKQLTKRNANFADNFLK